MARTLTRREKWLLITAGSLACFYLFYRLIFFPQWEDYLLVQAELKAKTERLTSLKSINAKLNSLAAKNKELAGNLENLKNFNPGHYGSILLRFDDLAFANGLELKFYRPKAPISGPIRGQSVEVSLAGPYDGIIEFFRVLDSHPYLAQVKLHQIRPLQFAGEGKGFPGNILEEEAIVYFSVDIYNLPEKSSLPARPRIAPAREQALAQGPEGDLPQPQETFPGLPLPELLTPEGPQPSAGLDGSGQGAASQPDTGQAVYQ